MILTSLYEAPHNIKYVMNETERVMSFVSNQMKSSLSHMGNEWTENRDGGQVVGVRWLEECLMVLRVVKGWQGWAEPLQMTNKIMILMTSNFIYFLIIYFCLVS